MTVKELIKKLSNYPEDTQIFLRLNDVNLFKPIEFVTEDKGFYFPRDTYPDQFHCYTYPHSFDNNDETCIASEVINIVSIE